MASPELVLAGSYDHGLVALSIVIAVLASYTDDEWPKNSLLEATEMNLNHKLAR